MKLKFKVQPYQTSAVESVVDCFAGQLNTAGFTYRIDPGISKAQKKAAATGQKGFAYEEEQQTGFKNADLQLTDAQLLTNIHAVQRRQNLPLSDKLVSSAGCKVNLDVEMETGTGKTYCYVKTFFEMNKRYGWTKFIVVVPSIAIREGVLKSLEITAEHFTESYGKKARFFAYNSRQLHHLESFSSDAGINVMVINIQAFNATGKDNRRIYDELDDFQSRKPIDVISSNRPILILDEPQKMEGKKTLEALAKFKPLMILRYSATHRTTHNKIHRLDALDAYNQKLVKKIAVRGIAVKGLAGTNAYLYLESIEISKKAPVARIEMEVRQGGGIKRIVKRLERGKDLFVESNELDQYRGFVIAQIDANKDEVEFTNGHVLSAGDATGDITEMAIRRIQIREAIKAHLEKEQVLFAQGIKVLSLFFIDEVVKYRDYSQADEQGEYARIFEEEYEQLKAEYLGELALDNEAYRKYLAGIHVGRTHNGYFSIDKKGRMVDTLKAAKSEKEQSTDVDAYDLILKKKEQLLSFDEPTRFIFSHSALREGWDNPNVFVMCMLKHSDNTISRRQEVGRGLRISVNQHGDRMDNPATVHDVNILTVVASESYKDFVGNLQREISDSLSARPRKADEAYFTGKVITTETGTVEITAGLAKQIYKYLLKNDYTDDADQVAEAYHEAKANGTLAELPPELAPHAEQIFGLIDSVFSESQLPDMGDDRKPKTNPLNANFEKKEFKALWSWINQKAVYRVEFDSSELIRNSIRTLDKELRVAPLQYTIQSGLQGDQITDAQLRSGDGFALTNTSVETHNASIHSMVTYDLLGKIAENTQLTRKTIAEVLSGVQAPVFKQFKQNPEHFIAESSRLINEQKATIIIERLSYDNIAETHDIDIFTAGQSKQDFTRASEKLKNHIYDYVITDSKVEREFVKELDTSTEVVVYAKLPRGFLIPTPVGDYNPDWAISFKEGSVKHIYFVAETKGSMSSMELRAIEHTKIECARKFFAEVNRKIDPENVKYDVVTSYGKLMEIVGAGTVSSGGGAC
ncbi:type III restriction-modification system endonuclease [Alloalcanivorax xenomutans]|jgi:type III restriction enzyme|uniref:DEAD/DEAH box helicase family protein n=1 Tax=Alloalcanivorax xenomutans TaxID=1094342 RepID=A0A9Q3W7G0_9GAMM|nr:DEAD/DEAH box helicase family protein [Alloalcanivorax xenomutans]MBA4721446.1 DEAD/DEAH box helicase family protein [Alcanivorax sp.]MCE7509722.1 DEAD/DEAH box helicase family protein [Alloalcanivorax xenomutans]CUR45084.1 Type III restriction enzyme, res subunit:DEAD/DEAH box helicase, N-terminal [Alloalcanivorax xenomutans]|tara:strand:- start:1784 stop:4885 length:3102 start_codon:yes stop_codon:yes gene_type:complete